MASSKHENPESSRDDSKSSSRAVRVQYLGYVYRGGQRNQNTRMIWIPPRMAPKEREQRGRNAPFMRVTSNHRTQLEPYQLHEVACPRCSVLPGQQCETRTGQRARRIHKVRLQAAVESHAAKVGGPPE